MDKTVLQKNASVIDKHYPNMNILQLGLLVSQLGILRAWMGHEGARGTIENYIHPKYLSDNVRQCLDFLEREVLALKKSKLDIDFWKRGKEGSFRRDVDKIYA